MSRWRINVPVWLAGATAGAALAGCATPEMSVADADRKAQMIAAIEAAGCRVDMDNFETVTAGFTDDEARQYGAELVEDGLADVSEFGVYQLRTENCT